VTNALSYTLPVAVEEGDLAEQVEGIVIPRSQPCQEYSVGIIPVFGQPGAAEAPARLIISLVLTDTL